MRLRALGRLEELEIRAERDRLAEERGGLEALLADEGAQWDRIAAEMREIRDRFGPPKTLRGLVSLQDLNALKLDHQPWPRGARRTAFAEAPALDVDPLDAMVEREPCTIACSRMGWIRVLKGRQPLDAELKWKDGDGPGFVFHAETTSKLLLLSSSGRVFTLPADRLPGGRGMGEPVRLMVDLANDDEIVALFPHEPGAKRLVASDAGDGFVAPEDEMLAQTRAGKQVLNVKPPAKAAVCRRVEGDHVAVVGANRKLLVFPLEELPEMARGKGVRLQKYKDPFANGGRLADAATIVLEEGIRWSEGGGRRRTVSGEALAPYLGRRAGAGAMAPRGFPKPPRFE